MLFRTLMISTLVVATALPAAAMTPSCGRTDPVELYREAHASADRFVILLGQLQTEEDLAELDNQHEPFVAPFTGHQLTSQGFTEPLEAPVEVTHFCDASFLGLCGSIMPGRETLLFARQAEDGSLHVTAGPCGQWAQQFVTPEEIEELTACAAGGCPTTP